MTELFGIPPMSYKDAVEASEQGRWQRLVDEAIGIMKQKTHVRFVSSAEWDRLEGHQKAIPSLKPKDMARIQRNINNDWLKICIRLVSAKRKNEQTE